MLLHAAQHILEKDVAPHCDDEIRKATRAWEVLAEDHLLNIRNRDFHRHADQAMQAVEERSDAGPPAEEETDAEKPAITSEKADSDPDLLQGFLGKQPTKEAPFALETPIF